VIALLVALALEPVKNLTSFELNQLVDFTFQAKELASQFHLTHLVGFALADRNRDENILAVRRDCDLRWLGLEFEISPIEIIRFQCLNVAFELFT